MRYLYQDAVLRHVELVASGSPHLLRMHALKPKSLNSTESGRISGCVLKAVRLEEENLEEILEENRPGRYCLIPPKPSIEEAEAFLSLEFQMMTLPLMRNVMATDIETEALARVTPANLNDVREVMEENGLFAEEEPKSSVNALTVVPGRQ